MASSSHSAHIKRFHVFPSFHGADVRRAFLSHLHNYFANKGITTFKDQEIERGHTIGPELVKAIRESRISIVLLSKNYASSSWCLDELVEILKCKEDSEQIVMTIFYNVDPSSVRKQKGDFGSAFIKTCEGKTEDVKQRWSKALTDVANIEGEHFLNWANEADMITKITKDVSKKLNVTLSRDFDDMVGLQTHLRKMNSLLGLERDDEVKMIGIWGPAGNRNLDVGNGLKTLAVKSLVRFESRIVPYQDIVMHSLLEKMGRQVVHEQSDEPGKRQFLVEPQEICDVLANDTGTGSIVGIIQYFHGCTVLYNDLEKLWDGIQLLPNLKTISLGFSERLKEIPNLLEAPNLETLTLRHCSSLVELPSSIRNLHKLKELDMSGCIKLRVVPTNINLASLERVHMSGCSLLRTFPDLSSNIKHLDVRDTKIKDVPASVAGRWSRCTWLQIGSKSLKRLTHLPQCV
ncbi:unnamed protein product [Microthlaspi erraticum]|uniref:TIR domain-containing protein n=1 Tax=Microthlaspi erraticum TaxID=1685480 RepID=A0A6D2HXT8_9BRAS|nr:unnamed protein product [Microthlaspi erraticum]